MTKNYILFFFTANKIWCQKRFAFQISRQGTPNNLPVQKGKRLYHNSNCYHRAGSIHLNKKKQKNQWEKVYNSTKTKFPLTSLCVN